jgi:hypothetical protein
MFEFCGKPFSAELVESLKRLRPQLSPQMEESYGPDALVITELNSLLTPDDMDGLCDRIDTILEDPIFPILDEYYNVPWPLV